MDFTEKLKLRGKAEEDMYFAKIDRELIKAMHDKQKSDEEFARHQQDKDANLFDTLVK